MGVCVGGRGGDLQADKQIFWLKVTVDHMLLVAVLESTCERSNVLHSDTRGLNAGDGIGKCGFRGRRNGKCEWVLGMECSWRTCAARSSGKEPRLCNSLYSSPLAAYSRIR